MLPRQHGHVFRMNAGRTQALLQNRKGAVYGDRCLGALGFKACEECAQRAAHNPELHACVFAAEWYALISSAPV